MTTSTVTRHARLSDRRSAHPGPWSLVLWFVVRPVVQGPRSSEDHRTEDPGTDSAPRATDKGRRYREMKVALVAVTFVVGATLAGHAQQPQIGVPVPPLGTGPFVFDTAEQHKIRVSVVTRGLSHPWGIAFLPDGSMLVTERPGRLRIIRHGALDQQPIAGVPQVRTDGNGGLMDVALHPRFADNRLVYLTYTKPVENGKGAPGTFTLRRWVRDR